MSARIECVDAKTMEAAEFLVLHRINEKCPCCKSTKILVTGTITDGSIRCLKCGIGVTKKHETRDYPDGLSDATIAWNRRG